jgi:hypothetical protein
VSSAITAVRPRAGVIAFARTHDALAIACLGLFAAILLILTWRTWGDVGSDTGYDLVAAARVADGDLPYRDFTYYYGPLAPFLLGFVTWLAGPGLTPAIVLGITVSFLIVGATYALARTQTGPLGAFLAAGLLVPVAFAPNNFSFVLPHTYAVTLGVLGVLAFLLAAGRFAASGRARWLVGAGGAAGIVAVTRPEFIPVVAVAAAVWLVLRARTGFSGIRETAAFALPAVGIPAAAYGVLIAAVSPQRLFLENLYPVEELRAAGNALLRAHAPLTASSFAELGLKTALYAVGAALLVLFARVLARRRPSRRLVGVLAAIGVGGLAAAAVAKSETLRYGLEFVYGWVPAGALLGAAVLLWRYRHRRGRWQWPEQAALLIVLALAVMAARTYGAFLIHAPEAQPAVYAFPLAAVLLVRLHLVELVRSRAAYVLGVAWLVFLVAAGTGLTAKDARVESAVISGPGGLIADEPEAAAVYQAALDAIGKRTSPGEPILLAPQLTSLYTLAERENPLPQISLLPGALPDAGDQRLAAARLEAAGVRLVVIDRREFPEYGHTSFGGSFDRVLAGAIREHFTLAATLRGDGAGAGARPLELWVRRSP